jgi:hypothetical protein
MAQSMPTAGTVNMQGATDTSQSTAQVDANMQQINDYQNAVQMRMQQWQAIISINQKMWEVLAEAIKRFAR